ncbi:MAG: type II secretion system protein GspC [Pseudomonadota bacterium]
MGGIIRQYSWIVDLVGILLCSFFLAKITGIYVGRGIEIKRSVGVLKPADIAPAEKKQIDASTYAVIGERNIFDASERAAQGEGGEGAGVVEAETVPTGEAVKTSLNIAVLGVLVVGDGRDTRSTATVSGGGGGKEKDKGKAAVYAVGDTESFAPGTKLTRVQPDRIEFVNSGRLEYAEVASEVGASIFGPPKREEVVAKEPAAKAETKGPLVKGEAPGKFTVDQREIDEAMQNLDRLYTDIRAVPNFSGGKVSGMKILSVKGDSLFAKLGLRRGDVLQKINGMELDVKRGFEIFNQLKDQKNITLDLLRRGQATTLDYEIR